MKNMENFFSKYEVKSVRIYDDRGGNGVFLARAHIKVGTKDILVGAESTSGDAEILFEKLCEQLERDEDDS